MRDCWHKTDDFPEFPEEWECVHKCFDCGETTPDPEDCAECAAAETWVRLSKTQSELYQATKDRQRLARALNALLYDFKVHEECQKILDQMAARIPGLLISKPLTPPDCA